MKEVNFLKLKGKNFLSIGNVPVEFNFPAGINLITGYNFDKNDDNGAGKTTVIQLFYWVLFGTCLSNLNKNEILNDINKKKCEGELEFEVIKNGNKTNYRIERGIKPSYCKLFIDGNEDTNPATIPMLNKQIEDIISSTALIFKNCIVLSINNSIPFMAQGKPERKKFVESMFRLESLRDVDKMARKAYNELVRSQDLNLEELKVLNANKEAYIKKEEQFELVKKGKINKLKIRKQSYVDEINLLNDKIIDVDTGKLKKLQLELESISDLYNELEGKKRDINSNILNYDKDLRVLSDKESNTSSIVIAKYSEYDSYISKEQQIKTKLDIIPDAINDLYQKNLELKTSLKNDIATLTKIEKYGDVCDKCERPFSKTEQEKTENSINKLTENISECKMKIAENEDEVQKNEDLKLKYKKILDLILNLKSYNQLKSEMQNLETKLENIKVELEPIKQELSLIEGSHIKCKTEISFIEESIFKNKLTLAEKENLTRSLSTVDDDILEAESEKNTFDALIVDNNDKIAECKSRVDLVSEDIEVYDSVKFIVSEDGIKSYIIKKLLTVLNERIEYYLKTLQSNATLSFDEYFDDTLFNDKGIEHSYDSFSGGERKRIDLACLFSFLDIRRIQGDVRFNVIFFDELLDSAISSKACDLVFNLLRERYDLYNESANIITHRKEFKSESKGLISNMIHFEKRNGFTKIGEVDGIKV